MTDQRKERDGPPASLYEHAGGEEALHRLEEILYSKALADPVLRSFFTERRPRHVDHLTWFTAESFGGPDRFTRELGFQHVIDVHRHLKIADEQRERFLALYMKALEQAGLANDERFREAVRSHVEFGSQVAQQNSWAETDADLHPSATFRTGSGLEALTEASSWTRNADPGPTDGAGDSSVGADQPSRR